MEVKIGICSKLDIEDFRLDTEYRQRLVDVAGRYF